jgi:hypothetical protein
VLDHQVDVLQQVDVAQDVGAYKVTARAFRVRPT